MRPTTILIVEDDRLVLRMVKDTLELEGWHVEVCENGLTALRMLESGAHYDLILTDNNLPGADGLELIHRAHELPHRQHTPIIMFSASSIDLESQRAGADAFLRKPDDMALVVGTIALLLNRSKDK